MASCFTCKTTSSVISKSIGLCLKCIRENNDDILSHIEDIHAKSREAFRLPVCPPKGTVGIHCNICVNECMVPENTLGYCGVRENIGGKISGPTADRGKLSWYHDPLPSNCVADWVCPGGTGAGYPDYAYCPGPERGYRNLAVFFHACTFNCLYCQNWHFRRHTFDKTYISLNDLVSDVETRVSCICYFGGDPTSQLPFSLKASHKAREKNRGRILRICWETNGSMHYKLLDRMVDIALESGGCIKFDLKAWHEKLHIALTGVTNKRTLENFRRAAARINHRPVPPLLVASTLLVPGYIDEKEVRNLASYISSINPDIPYSLLAFYPQFYMSDMPITTKAMAYRCLEAAREEGLKNVRIGNVHLLC